MDKRRSPRLQARIDAAVEDFLRYAAAKRQHTARRRYQRRPAPQLEGSHVAV